MIQHLDEFLDFVEKNPDSTCKFTRVFRAGQQDTAPKNPLTIPGGTLSIFDPFIAFVTTDTFSTRSSFTAFVEEEIKPHFAFAKFIKKLDVISVAEFITNFFEHLFDRKELTATEIKQRLSGTSSFVIPTKTIIDVEFQKLEYTKWRLGYKVTQETHIMIHTSDGRSFVICVDDAYEANVVNTGLFGIKTLKYLMPDFTENLTYKYLPRIKKLMSELYETIENVRKASA